MKTKRFLPVILILSIFCLSGNILYAQTQVKEIKKDFQINKGDVLSMENKFGNIDILNWEKPEISISVKLSAEGRNDATAKGFLDKISIEIIKENNTVSVMTKLDNESGMSKGNQLSINYTVYAPEWINLNLNNKFGNIHINEISGLVNIDLKYGDMKITRLSRGNEKPFSNITLAFANGVIEQSGSLKLVLSYSKLEVENAEILSAESKYSGINVTSCNSFICESKYDNFKFSEIRNLIGDLQFSNLRAGTISGKLELDSKYSGVKIDQVLPSFENIKINNDKGGYKIGLDPETSFELTGTSDRGDISVEGYTILEKKTDGTSKYIRATGGTKSSGKLINITVVDGAVSLFSN